MSTRARYIVILMALVTATVAVDFGVETWNDLHRDVPQPGWIFSTLRARYLYGSVGTEEEAGIPYWIWLVLPQMFPEYLPGPGSYLSLGVSWEETKEMPVGFSKKRLGYVRVAGNCALCHAHSSLATEIRLVPIVRPAAKGDSQEVLNLTNFYRQCAQDPRFNVENILAEISSATKLTLTERMIYRYKLIPEIRERFLKGDHVLIGSALVRHSQNPQGDGPEFRQRMRELENDLRGQEKDTLTSYLKTLP